jgi:hypothetical protein
MDHKALAEQYLQAPMIYGDGSPHNWQKMLTHAMLHCANAVEALTIVIADAFNEEEE